MKFLSYLLFLMFFYQNISAQTQNICYGAVKDYSVDLTDGATGTPNSTYAWTVVETTFSGSISGKVTAAVVNANAIIINWNTTPAGNYTLRVVETNNGCSGSQNLTIIINPLPTITGTLSACAGSTTQLSGSTIPNATNPWTSSDTAIATISSSGLVTGLSAGTTTITYTNSKGCTIVASVTIAALTTSPINFN